jgi:hypothetical protein
MRNEIPKPKIWRSCTTGAQNGLHVGAFQSCRTTYTEGDACNGMKDEFPKPQLYSACRKGQTAAVSLGRSKMAEILAEKAAGAPA